MLGQEIALDRPAVRAAGRDHPRVLARAVVVDRIGGTSILRAALELLLTTAGRCEEGPHGFDVHRRAGVRRGRDRQLARPQLRVRARERQRLKRLGSRAKGREQRGIAGLGDHNPVLHRDRVHAMDRFEDLPTPHGYAERLSGQGMPSLAFLGRRWQRRLCARRAGQYT